MGHFRESKRAESWGAEYKRLMQKVLHESEVGLDCIVLSLHSLDYRVRLFCLQQINRLKVLFLN